MIIERLDFPSPLLVLDEFLPPIDASACLRECIALEPVYMPAHVGAGNAHRIDPTIRANDVVMLDSVFSTDRRRSKLLTLIRQRVNSVECKALWHDGEWLFDIINFRTWDEAVLSRYGQCDFYGKHQDTVFNSSAPGQITRRIVTLVYYMNTEPEQFEGGALTLYKNGVDVTVTPKHNRAVVFPSFTLHRVGKVTLPPDAPFSAGRFSLNNWMGFRETGS